MSSILFDDDDNDGDGSDHVDEKPARRVHGGADRAQILDLVTRVPGLRLVPVSRDKIPLIKGWADAMFWQRLGDQREAIESWCQRFGQPNFAMALGPRCGAMGALVVEADNQAGEDWLQTRLPPTPIMTGTRHGWAHRLYVPDIVDAETGMYRGNYVDVLGAKKKWERQATELGYRVTVDRKRAGDLEHLAHVADERERAAKNIAMGPVIDIKCVGGQAMAPGSVHATGFRYHEVDAWTQTLWAQRPVFNPKWFPDEVWVARDAQHLLAIQDRAGAHVDEGYWTPERRFQAALRYTQRVPPVRTGNQGAASKTFMRLATVLMRGFMLDGAQARELAAYWGREICRDEPWSAKEIEHKLREAQARGAMAWGEFLRDRSTQPEARLEAAERHIAGLMGTRDAAIAGAGDHVHIDDVELPPDYDAARVEAESDGDVRAREPDDVFFVMDDDDMANEQEAPPLSSSSSRMTSTSPGYSAPAPDDSLRRVFGHLGIDVDDIRGAGEVYQAKTDSDGNAVSIEPTSVNMSLIFRFSHVFRGKFRLNLLGQIEEFAGKPIDDYEENEIRLSLSRMLGKEIPAERARAALMSACRLNQYDPLMSWIETLPEWDGVERLRLVPEEILHVKENVAHCRVLFEKFCLSAMARAMRPGCKADAMLVLQSANQGWFKSTFAKELFTERFFSDQHIDIRDKDSRILMAQHWCMEVGEGEVLTTPSKVMALKQFLSQPRDDIRLPYGRRVVRMPRRCVFFATTNESQLLHDSTGSRRFWIIEPGGPADIDKLQAWREQMWAEARTKVYAHMRAPDKNHPDYARGQWWLTGDEQARNDEHNVSRQYEDAWESDVFAFLGKQGRRPFMPVDVLKDMQVPTGTRDWVTSRRVCEILRRVGCKPYNGGKLAKCDGRVGRFWHPPENLPGDDDVSGDNGDHVDIDDFDLRT